MRIHALKLSIVLSSIITVAGCSSALDFPDVSNIKRVSGEILTKEQKDERIKDLQKEKEAHKKEAEN